MSNRYSPEVQQMQDMLEAQVRLREAALGERATAIDALVNIAETFCVGPWDEEKRAGHQPEAWPPERTREFVIRHLRATLRQAMLANRPQLVENNERLARELAEARQEINKLRLQLRFARPAPERLANNTAPVVAEKQSSQPTSAVNIAPAEPEVTAVSGQSAAHPPASTALAKRFEDLVLLLAATGIARGDLLREKLASQWAVDLVNPVMSAVIAGAAQQALVSARACGVEWAPEQKGQFIVLDTAGTARAIELGVEPVVSEYSLGHARNWSLEHLYLALKAVDILAAEGYADVEQSPAEAAIGGRQFKPDLLAREAGHLVPIFCPASRDDARAIRWEIAAQAGGGVVRVIAGARKSMDAITSEIKAASDMPPAIMAMNVAEYLAGRRGTDGALWFSNASRR